MADIKIYNSGQIGANYTVIASNEKKIMIDYGQSLPGTAAEQEDFDWEHDTVEAVFFTHYHGDHMGRILDIPKNVALYMGEVTRRIMLNIHESLAKVDEFREEQMQYVELLKDQERIHAIKAGKSCGKIGDMEVIP